MFAYEPNAHVACNFNCHIGSDGLLTVTRSHVYSKGRNGAR